MEARGLRSVAERDPQPINRIVALESTSDPEFLKSRALADPDPDVRLAATVLFIARTLKKQYSDPEEKGMLRSAMLAYERMGLPEFAGRMAELIRDNKTALGFYRMANNESELAKNSISEISAKIGRMVRS